MSAALTALHPMVNYDPVRDKTYRRAKLAGDVVAWLDWMALGGAAPRTLEQYEHDLSRLCKLYPAKELAEITDADLLALARKFSSGEVRTRMAAVKSFFKWAKQQRRIADNPCDYLPPFKPRPQKYIEIFTEAEVLALTGLEVRDGALMQVLLDAGLRKAEARSLRLRDYKPEPTEVAPAGNLVVLRGKGGKDRVIPATLAVAQKIMELATLEGLGSKDHLWYDRPGGHGIRRASPIIDSVFDRWWRRCLSGAGVQYRNPHTTRHTFATRWLRRGGSLITLSMVMGHASIKTTSDLYAHLNTADIARDLALIEGGA